MTRNASRLGMGIVVGGLLAMGATVAQREIMRRAGTRLIDWETVRGIARRRLGADGAPLRTEVRAFGRGLLPRRRCCGSSPWWPRRSAPSCRAALETPAVIDRLEWIDLNLVTFEQLFDRIEQIMAEPGRERTRQDERWPASSTARSATSSSAS